MSRDPIRILESSCVMEALIFISEHEGCTKMDVYRGVVRNSAMPAKLDMMAEAGLISFSARGRSTGIDLTDTGRRVAACLAEIRDTLADPRLSEDFGDMM